MTATWIENGMDLENEEACALAAEFFSWSMRHTMSGNKLPGKDMEDSIKLDNLTSQVNCPFPLPKHFIDYAAFNLKELAKARVLGSTAQTQDCVL